MGNLIASVDLKCRLSGIDVIRPRKEIYQRFQKFKINTQPIDSEEWWLRIFIAYMILKYGTEMEDWGWDDEWGDPDDE